MQKYALFTYTKSNNVGDEIQSISARQFLPQVDYYIDRDLVGEWRNSNRNEIVKLIANGWFMHKPHAWPSIDENVVPLLVSMHINSTDPQTKKTFEETTSTQYMKYHGPVGARDLSTLKFLSENNVETYFSACLTLTLQPDSRIIRQEYILAISVSDEVYHFIKNQTKKKVIRINPYANKGIDSMEKFKIAEYMLFLYQSASCVVTTKIHAMLPCLALQTPVLFIDESETYDPSRLDGLLDFVRVAKRHKILKGADDYNFDSPPDNPGKYRQYANSLAEICEQFTGFRSNKSFIKYVDINKIDQDKFADKFPISGTELSASKIVSYLKNPFFSIIIPAYNVGDCLRETVDSLKNQSFTDFECIIVDDGSTDGGVDSISKQIENDPRFRIIKQKNGGLSNARNRGYKDANGDYILFLDGDDVFSEKLLSTIYERAGETGSEVIIYNYATLDNVSGRRSKKVHELASLAKKRIIRPKSIGQQLFTTFGNQVWTKAFKRDFIAKHKLVFDEDLKRAEDIPYTYPALLMAKSITVIDEPLVFYRTNRGTSNSDSLVAHHKDIFYALDLLYKVISKQDKAELFRTGFAELFLENVYYNLCSLMGTSTFASEHKLAKQYTRKLGINTQIIDANKPELLKIYNLFLKGSHEELLVYIAKDSKERLAKNEATIQHLSDHVEQLQGALNETRDAYKYSQDSLVKMQADYEAIKNSRTIRLRNWLFDTLKWIKKDI